VTRVLIDIQVPQVQLAITKRNKGWHSISGLQDLSNVHFPETGLTWSTFAYIVFVCLAAATSLLLGRLRREERIRHAPGRPGDRPVSRARQATTWGSS
jgi:hypothetical protein